MKKGKLFYNRDLNRYDIEFNDGTTYGGLHCGDCFSITVDTRIEMSGSEWYLIGLNTTLKELEESNITIL